MPLGGHLREAGPDGKSLMDLLRDRGSSQAEITRRLEAVAARLRSEQRGALPSVRSLARKHRIPLERVREQQDEIDVLTGKRFEED